MGELFSVDHDGMYQLYYRIGLNARHRAYTLKDENFCDKKFVWGLTVFLGRYLKKEESPSGGAIFLDERWLTAYEL